MVRRDIGISKVGDGRFFSYCRHPPACQKVIRDELHEVAAKGVALVKLSSEVVNPATYSIVSCEDREASRFPT